MVEPSSPVLQSQNQPAPACLRRQTGAADTFTVVASILMLQPSVRMLLLFFATFLAGLWLTRSKDEAGMDKFLKLTVLLLSVLILSLQLEAILWAPHFFWNHARLLPVELFVQGHPLYTEASAGVIHGNLYGPYAHWLYLPVTCLHAPDSMVMAGSALSSLFLWLPAFLVMQESLRTNGQARIWTCFGFVLFLAVAHLTPALRQVFRNIHADAPAIGFSALALYFVLVHLRSGLRKHLVCGCLAAALAVWSKQIAVMIVPLIPLLLWRLGNRAGGLVAARVMLVCGLGVSVLTILLCRQFSPQLLNLWQIPGSHPWISSIYETGFPRLPAAWGERPQILIEAALQLLEQAKLIVGLFALGLAARWFLKGNGQSNQPRHPLTALLITGSLLIPMGLLGRVKVGGDLNAFGFPLYFFALAAVLQFVCLCQSIAAKLTLPRGRLAATIMAGMFALAAAGLLHGRLTRPPKSPETAVMDYLVRSEKTAYFPWNPLAHLQAQQQAVHFQYAIYDRDLARMPASQPHYASGVPANVCEFVVPADAWFRRFTETTLSNRFDVLGPPDAQSLAGWLIYPVRLRSEDQVSLEDIKRLTR
jgi:hypothetical protein